jgi:uncharacterized membrane protein
MVPAPSPVERWVARAEEREMNVRIRIAKHPIHPMLVPLPLAAVGFAIVADVAYAFTGAAHWFTWGRVALVATAVLELITLLARGADYFGRVLGQRGARLATAQLMVNVVVVGLLSLSAFVRSHGTPAEQFPAAALTLVLALALWALSLALAQKTEDEFPLEVDPRADARSLQSI